MRKTKIIATLGPATSSDSMIERLIRAGVDTFRLNFSHGTHKDHWRNLRRVRRISARLKRPVAVLQDLQGPKIRTGIFENGSVQLRSGALFTLTARNITGGVQAVSTTYKRLPRDVKPGEMIYLNDGLLKLKVVKVNGPDIVTRVVTGGTLSDHKGINLPGTRISSPALTRKDTDDLRFGLALGVDYVALSFVRKAGDILRVRRIIEKNGNHAGVIAKIEKPEALDNIDSILEAADGIMVARGDLGVEISPEAVPAWQKRLIKLAVARQRIVITATQMLESMTQNPFPTRAEASDVANAVYDGTDAVMLSAETAVGRYPLECARMMVKIVRSAEAGGLYRHAAYAFDDVGHTAERALTGAALLACEEIGGRTVIAFTRSGRTARSVSQRRRDLDIFALSPDPCTVNRLALCWGVAPRRMAEARDLGRMVEAGIEKAREVGLVRRGERVVVLAGDSFRSGSTNLLKIVRA